MSYETYLIIITLIFIVFITVLTALIVNIKEVPKPELIKIDPPLIDWNKVD